MYISPLKIYSLRTILKTLEIVTKHKEIYLRIFYENQKNYFNSLEKSKFHGTKKFRKTIAPHYSEGIECGHTKEKGCYNYSKFRKKSKDLLCVIATSRMLSIEMFFVFIKFFKKCSEREYINFIVFGIIKSYSKFKSYHGVWLKSCYSFSKTW